MSSTDTTENTETIALVADRLRDYREHGLAAVQGWFASESAEVIATLLAHQVATGLRGDVAEIGVHHGKSFLLLANGTRPGERAVALDVFGQQDKNVDNSGLGDRAIFEANAAEFAPAATIETLEMSSLDVTPETASDVFGELRLMSVDGGHTAAITAHDLRLAEAALLPDGVVVLDDVLNGHWLGVITGLFDFLGGDTLLVPFAVSENKLYLARPEAAARYASLLRAELPDLLGKTGVEFHGGEVDVYSQGAPRRARERREAAEAAERADTEQAAAAKELAQLTRERDVARRRVTELQSSQSWRVTAPLRALSARRASQRERRCG